MLNAAALVLPQQWAFPALALVGCVAGIINSMAGGGGFLTLPALMAFGVPPGVANGTIRVAVLLQNLSGTITFHRRGIRPYATAMRLILPMAAGAAGGSWLATRMSDEHLRPLIGGVLVAWALVLLLKPGRFARSDAVERKPGALAFGLSLLIGIYGGFLQAGVGFPLLALLVSYLGYDPVRANAIKVCLVLLYTCLALPVFAQAGQVAWAEGGALAFGSMVGAWLGARWQMRGGAKLVRWFVMIAVAVAGATMLLS